MVYGPLVTSCVLPDFAQLTRTVYYVFARMLLSIKCTTFYRKTNF